MNNVNQMVRLIRDVIDKEVIQCDCLPKLYWDEKTKTNIHFDDLFKNIIERLENIEENK